MSDEAFANQSKSGEIPSYDGDEKAKATDFANYFCSYAQLYHQKQMLVDHNRMASYHQAIMGNAEVFKDKVSDREVVTHLPISMTKDTYLCKTCSLGFLTPHISTNHPIF